MRPLFPHQERALDHLNSVRHGALFMEMRLGKTLTVIRWVQSKPEVERVLIVAPVTVLAAWEKELRAEGERFTRVEGSHAWKRRMLSTPVGESGRRWFLVGYEAVRALPTIAGVEVRTLQNHDPKVKKKRRVVKPCSGGWEFDVVVLDESTKIKNPSALITRVCLVGFRGALHRIILSGLPNPESVMNYWAQFAFLRGRFMGYKSFWHWRSRFFEADPDGWEWEPLPKTEEAIRTQAAAASFVLSRKDAGLGERRIYQEHEVEMTPLQRRTYREVLGSFAWDGGETTLAIVQLTWLHRIAGGFTPDGKGVLGVGKFNALQSLLEDELEGQNVVVWFRFNAEIAHAYAVLRARGIPCRMLTGVTIPDQRADAVREFGNGTRVLLLQEAIGQFGLDLSAASTAIYFSNAFSPEQRAQSEDRILHPQKKEPLLFIDLLSRGSMDREVLGLLQEKVSDAKMFLRALSRYVLNRYNSPKQKLPTRGGMAS